MEPFIEFATHLFSTAGWPPRWFCGYWTPFNGWLYIISSLMIWSAYISIPVILLYLVRHRRDLPFLPIFGLFALFIVACGTTHLVDALMFWWPAYRFSALTLLVTGIISWATVFALIPILPKALALKSPQALEKEIEERKSVEAQLVKAREEALQASRWKSEFLATMSHEIRTPLHGMMGMTEMLLDLPTTPDQRSHLNIIHSSGQTLMNLINDILDFSKIEAGRLSMVSVPIQLRETVASIVRPFELSAQTKRIGLSYHVDPQVPNDLVTDPLRFGQVLTNLISNAIKFTETGHVEVALALESQTPAYIVLYGTVTDTGLGLTEEQQQFIFEPFTQIDGSMTRRFPGTGLGLSITAQLLAMMGGKIWVTSQLGEGSVFHFTMRLPCGQAKGSVKVVEQHDVYKTPSLPLHVLLVEDNEINRMVATHILTRAKHTIDVAVNGKEALEKWQAHLFDVILMDVHMPDMDGFEATQVIRDHERTTGKHMPIIALTANALADDKDRCLASGMDAYIAKPFSAKVLLDTIDDVMHRVTPISYASESSTDTGKMHLLDEMMIAQLSESPVLLEKVIGLFEKTAPEHLAHIYQAIEQRDANALSMAAHTLKGAIGNFTNKEAYKLALLLETMGMDNNFSDADSVYHQLEMSLDELKAALHQLDKRA